MRALLARDREHRVDRLSVARVRYGVHRDRHALVVVRDRDADVTLTEVDAEVSHAL